MKIIKKQMKGGLCEMKYKKFVIAMMSLMLLVSMFGSFALVSAEENDEGTMDPDMQDEPNRWGEDKYEVKIEGFMGYNDPFSRRSWETMQQLHDEFGDRVTFIFRNYPFEFNDGGYKVAQAGECVFGLSDKATFFKYTDYIMNLDDSERLNSDEAIEIADDLGLDIRGCVIDAKFLPEVQDDRSDGIKKGGGELGTPTFFIGTKQINGAQPYSVFREAVQDQLGDDSDDEEVQYCEEGLTMLIPDMKELTIQRAMANINSIGLGYVEELASNLPNVIAATILTEDTYFSLTDTIQNSKKISIDGKTYLVELISASDDYATIKVTGDNGRTETKEIAFRSVEYILEVPFGIVNIAKKNSNYAVGITTKSLILSTDTTPKGKVVVADQIYYIELISGSETEATIEVTCGPVLPHDNGGGNAFVLFDGEAFITENDGGSIILLTLLQDGEKVTGAYSYLGRYSDEKHSVTGNIVGENINFGDGKSDFEGVIKTYYDVEPYKFIVISGDRFYTGEGRDHVFNGNFIAFDKRAYSEKDGDEEEGDQKQDDDQSKSYRYAHWACYDGASERQGGETSCKSSETWSQYAKEFCEGRCYEDGSKCGVNSFGVEQECSYNEELTNDKKIVFASRIDEVKTLMPESTNGDFVKGSSGDADRIYSNSETGTETAKEIKVTPKRIESQRALGIIPKFWSEDKAAVVEFNDGEKTSTVTINEGEAKQVEGYVIEVGKIDSEGKIPIAVSSVLNAK